MATEILGFTNREMRDEQYLAWKAEGSTGLGKHTTHIDNRPAIVFVVTRHVPAAVEPEGTKTKVLSTESSDSEKMVSEGGNINAEENHIQAEAKIVQPANGGSGSNSDGSAS